MIKATQSAANIPHKNIEISNDGQFKHFLSISNHSKETLTKILDLAESFINFGKQEIKKVPLLRGKTIVNLFFEPSTRTRTTFEIAAKRLSADVINLDATRMSTSKGESILDTVATLEAMHVDMFVIRDRASGTAELVARHLPGTVRVINAGDGRHAHPTQAMLDMFTIRHYKGKFDQLKVVIVGDILHSRVARSQIQALRILGAKEIRVVGPRTLMPTKIENMGVIPYTNLDEALDDIDVILMLRLQSERMDGQQIPSQQEYFYQFGLSSRRLKLAKADAIVMHPGPMNRGLEIASEVADGEQSVILPQVTNGIAVRMAIMAMLMGGQANEGGEK